jgi:hypothetical protein
MTTMTWAVYGTTFDADVDRHFRVIIEEFDVEAEAEKAIERIERENRFNTCWDQFVVDMV